VTTDQGWKVFSFSGKNCFILTWLTPQSTEFPAADVVGP